MKRLLALFVALTLVLATTAGAFAAKFEDIEGTDYEDAVTILNTLEILTGYPDGTFKPDSTITRAEFAAVAIRALGMEDLAKLQAGPTPFPDVPATHWASGYINLAADQGLLKGYPDGTFKPSNQVSYVESLAILVRALGYDRAVKGSWPTNYMIKAFELDLTGNVSFTYNESATRGDVALFTENSLTVPLMVQTSAGDEEKWEADPDTSLLETKLDFTTETGFIQEVPQMFGDSLDDDEVVIGGEKLEVAEGLDLLEWLGREVKYWAKSDTIYLVELLTDEDDVIVDTVVDFTPGTTDKIELDDLDETLDVSDDAILIRNLVDGEDPQVDDKVTVVIDEDDVVQSVVALCFDEVVVLTDIDEDDEELEGYDATATEVAYDLEDYDEALIVKGGQVAAIEDLAKLDVVHLLEDATNDAIYLEAYADTIKGEVDEITGKGSSVDVTVDGEDYTLEVDAATSSTDDNDKFGSVSDEVDLADFAGEDVTLYLDRDGNVRHISADVDVVATEDIVGLVTTVPDIVSGTPDYWSPWGPPGDASYTFKILTPAGDTVSYSVPEDDGADVFPGNPETVEPFAVGDIVTVTVDEDDGEVTEVVLEVADASAATITSADDLNDDHNRIQVSSSWYRIASDTAIYEIYDNNTPGDTSDDEYDVLEWEALANVEATTFDVDFWQSGVVADYIVVYNPHPRFGYGAADDDKGVVYKRYVSADGTAFRILLGDGTTANYLAPESASDVTSLAYENNGATGDDLKEIEKFEFVNFELDAGGEEMMTITEEEALGLEDAAATPNTLYYVYINKQGIDADNLILDVRVCEDSDDTDNEDYELLLSKDTVIYDCTGTYPEVVEFGDLRANDQLQVFGDDQFDITHVKIVD